MFVKNYGTHTLLKEFQCSGCVYNYVISYTFKVSNYNDFILKISDNKATGFITCEAHAAAYSKESQMIKIEVP